MVCSAKIKATTSQRVRESSPADEIRNECDVSSDGRLRCAVAVAVAGGR